MIKSEYKMKHLNNNYLIKPILYVSGIKLLKLVSTPLQILQVLQVTYWLATFAQKPKLLGSSPAASYVQRWTLCSNCPANVKVSVKRVEVVVRS